MVRFPNESTEYRNARNALLEAELALRAKVEAVAALRRQLPLGGAVREDYVFEQGDGAGGCRDVRLSDLFEEGKDSLFLYSFMYAQTPCPMCSALMDGLNGQLPHLQQNISVAVVAKNECDVLDALAKEKGWTNVRFLSSLKTSFNQDYFGETDGQQNGMAHVFTRREGVVHHFWSSEMHFAGSIDGGNPRHVDQLWPLWNVLDLTPDGRGQWFPSLTY